ncbi:hypothetical protein DYB28_010270 [Aphanomyces astaci]|uniref:non-specific serine/threonine protein kinase n=1 Tax=Aphanomyces astaci TaxID=112090 RepID=A0A9X8DR31_APHAT|nr:hypothetical protein DYB28_010270 [Aphanomyces astaci]
MGLVCSCLSGGGGGGGKRFRDQYQLGDKIGEGAFSVVRRATHRQTNVVYAVKCFKKVRLTEQDVKDIHGEVGLLKQMKHPNVLNLHGFFDEPEYYYTVMDLVEGGELFDRIVDKEFYTEKECRDLIKILLDTITYCHGLGIVHRDLKPDNILMTSRDDDASIKIADFGLAKQDSQDDNLVSSCGTPEYIAPEVVRNVFSKDKQLYGKAVDIWSIGVITYVMLCGYTPFHANSQVQLFRKIIKGQYQFHSPYWDDVSPEAQTFVSRMLVVDPKQRATAEELLADPWMTLGDEDVNFAELNGVSKRMTSRQRLKAAMATVQTTMALTKAMANNKAVVPATLLPAIEGANKLKAA